MNKLLSDVIIFHKTYGQPIGQSPEIPSQHRQDLRIKLIAEEFQELKDAFAANSIVDVADALTDLLYVINGCIIECGLQHCIEKCHDEVQASNMSKLDKYGNPIYRHDGKILKGPLFFKPNLTKIINEQTNTI